MKANPTIQSLCALLVFISISARTISAKAQDNKTERMVEIPGLGSLKSSEALEYALTIGNLDMVKIAVEGGADVNKARKVECPLVMASAYNGKNNLAIVRYLLENGAVLSGHNGAAALDMAVNAAGTLRTFDLATKVQNVAVQKPENNTSHEERDYQARHPEFVEIIKLFLKHGAKVDGIVNERGEGNTPLRKAVASGDLKIVKILLEHGASTKIKFHEGFAPLMMAATANQFCEDLGMNYIVAYYKSLHQSKAPEKKAVPSILDGMIDPAQLAIIYGSMNQSNTHQAQRIKDNQAKWIDLFQDYTEITKLLISKGVNVNEKHLGASPLDQAKGYYNTPMINALVAAGAK
jgi:ankyrin repeat protein